MLPSPDINRPATLDLHDQTEISTHIAFVALATSELFGITLTLLKLHGELVLVLFEVVSVISLQTCHKTYDYVVCRSTDSVLPEFASCTKSITP